MKNMFSKCAFVTNVLLVSFWSLFLLNLSHANNAETFAKHALYQNVVLSPDGEHLAVRLYYQDEPALAVINLQTKQPISLIEFTRDREPAAFRWANNERLIVSLATRSGSLEQPLYTGELFAINKDGKRGVNIFGYRAEEPRYASGTMLDALDDKHILVQVQPWGRAGMDKLTEVVKVNIYNGRTRKVIRSDLRGASFLLDRDKEPRFAIGADNNADTVISIKEKGKLDWKEFESPFIEGSAPISFDSSNESVYVLGATKNDKSISGLYRFNLKTRVYEKLYHNGVSDVVGASIDSDGDLIGVTTSTTYPEFHVLDADNSLAGVISSLVSSFADYNVSITSISEDNKRMVAVVSSPVKTPEYYLYDAKKGSVEFLFDVFPWIEDAALSQSDAFKVEARDGLTLYGYITLPKGSEKPPLVVMPHGGPHARDYWGFDPSVQFLASAGYAVLQVNFRGSTGYGKNFMEAGYGEWGRKTQEDIIDATRWAINQGLVDGDRVAIFGASFGGYSALQAPIVEPGLFKAAIGYVGVYDLDMLYTTGDIETIRWGDAYLDKTLPKTEEQRRAQSPVHNLDKLDLPLFIVHGVDDPRAAFEHAEALRDALDEINYPYEWLAKDGEGHGFYDVDNRIELNNKVLAFLEKHLN